MIAAQIEDSGTAALLITLRAQIVGFSEFRPLSTTQVCCVCEALLTVQFPFC